MFDVIDCTNRCRKAAPGLAPWIGVVLGSGLGAFADQVTGHVEIGYRDLPGFPASTIPGHSGKLVMGSVGANDVVILSGRSHFYEHGDAGVMQPCIALLKALGCRVLILTNAAGSTRADLVPGTAMLITDHINWSGCNPLIGKVGTFGFVDMTYTYDEILRSHAHRIAKESDVRLVDGVYGWFSGPSYETPAEIRAARLLGVDAVGMSTVPEAILARAHGLRVIGISMITNLGAGLSEGRLDHADVQHVAANSGAKFVNFVTDFVTSLGADI